ncbi:hypothetical protein D3C78_852220 [compost metagenome]
MSATKSVTSYDHPQGGTMGLPANVYIDVQQRDAASRLHPFAAVYIDFMLTG